MARIVVEHMDLVDLAMDNLEVGSLVVQLVDLAGIVVERKGSVGDSLAVAEVDLADIVVEQKGPVGGNLVEDSPEESYLVVDNLAAYSSVADNPWAALVVGSRLIESRVDHQNKANLPLLTDCEVEKRTQEKA